MTRRLRPADVADWTPDRIAAANVAELAAGRVPLRAQWRLAAQRERAEAGEPGAFTYDLTVEEFAAIRSVGFHPVGQVLGTAVYTMFWVPESCGVSRFTRVGSPVLPARAVRRTLSEARAAAVARMRYECGELGGDGVVGVRFEIRLFHEIGLEFLAIGTAVRADGPTRPREPFTSDVSGQDFAKLLGAGWVPVAFVQGVGVTIRHGKLGTGWLDQSWVNSELTMPTELIHAARDAAREDLRAQAARAGAQGVVLRDMTTRAFERECSSGLEGAEDRLVEAILTGTAIVRYDRKARPAPAPLTMLRLNPQRKATNDGDR